MTSKKEYEELLNKLLGLQVKWSKLSKEELSSITTLFTSPSELAKRLGLSSYPVIDSFKERLRETIDSLGLRAPIMRLVKNLLREEELKSEKL